VNPREGMKFHMENLRIKHLHTGEACEGIFHTFLVYPPYEGGKGDVSSAWQNTFTK
jgi:hypothetical protein